MSGPHQVVVHKIGPHQITASVREQRDRGGYCHRHQTYQYIAVHDDQWKTVVIQHEVYQGSARSMISPVLSNECLEKLVFKKLGASTEFFDVLNDGTVIMSLSTISAFCSIDSRSTN
jgi:hypothetical protein